MKKFAYVFIISGAFLWGLIGLFVEKLSSLGFSPIQIVSIRVAVAGIILFLYVLMTNPPLLKIKITDVKYFIGTGVCSIVFFNWCYFTAIKETSLAVASILLYTAPAFVIILSRIFFKESLTRKKLCALTIAFLGCTLVVGGISNQNHSISLFGIVMGVGSGFGYALYSIFGKVSLKKYSVTTINTYTFLIASITIIPISGIWEALTLFTKPVDYLYGLGLGIFPTLLAFGLYSLGLLFVESSKAAITAGIEPVVATLLGVIVFEEFVTLWQITGILLVLLSILLIQDRKKVRKRKHSRNVRSS